MSPTPALNNLFNKYSSDTDEYYRSVQEANAAAPCKIVFLAAVRQARFATLERYSVWHCGAASWVNEDLFGSAPDAALNDRDTWPEAAGACLIRMAEQEPSPTPLMMRR
jgi:hypothetical protein